MKGEGDEQDYGMRIYDGRIGKFLSIDPLTESYPELTPYQFASNTPIEGIDLDVGEVRHTQMFRGQMYESLASDAIRHPIPSGAYLPSNGAATGGSANVRRGFIAAGAVVIGVVAAPTVALITESAFWKIALWGSQPQNQILVAEGVTFTAGVLNPGPEDISPGSSSDELGQAVKKLPRIIKSLAGKSINAESAVGSQVAKTFDPEAFAKEIIEINKGTDGKGYLLNGMPSTAINTAMYYSIWEEMVRAVAR